MKLKVIPTGDGSSTLYNSELDETYHSTHGAKQESEHVYLKSGLDYFSENNTDIKEISVFEVGFGTGMNILLSYYWAKQKSILLKTTTIEAFPLDSIDIKDYDFRVEDKDNVVTELHNLDWGTSHKLSNYFEFKKLKISLEDFNSAHEIYDVVYFDAFAPNKQEDIWSKSNLLKMYNVLRLGGCLVTYCAKGEIRRRFEEVGFTVSRIDGPPGKREMLRCEKV